MSNAHVLLLTDVVDSTRITERLGDAGAAALWAAHDRRARELLRAWRGREIDKSDGLLVLFESAEDAVGFAGDYHRALAALEPPILARVGIHAGELQWRENRSDDVARGAKPVEVDGLAKPLAARVMSLARGGQTLVSAAVRAALGVDGCGPAAIRALGFWRLKGIEDPIELFELETARGGLGPPPDHDKAWRVVRRSGLWLPLREVPHSLPAERDAFVGRQAALRDIDARIRHGARLVSLLGIGGSGKTRLAQRFGWSRLGDFPGGVWFCDLSAARVPDDIVRAVAQGLQVKITDAEPLQQLAAAIAGRGACLVVLDNFEQVARHAEATIGRWLEHAPDARFVVTTREVLGIVGEDALALPPMSAGEAEALFRTRAAALDARLPAGDVDRSIVELVAVLDGLPLAIELAASRVRVMPPRMMLQRMGERFKLLATTGGRHDRQATLRATLDWSWDLLSPAERAALAQLSVFEGGFTLEAAEAVIDLSALAPASWTLDVVQSLVQKSLVRKLGDTRLDLLRTVQDYAAEQLATPGRFDGSGESSRAAAWRRHIGHYAGVGEQGGGAEPWADAGNLVAACRRAQELDDLGAAGACLGVAWSVLRHTGPFQAAADLAQSLLDRPGLSDADRAGVEWVAGRVAWLLGSSDAAEAHHRRGQGLAAARGLRRLLGLHGCGLAEADMAGGRHAEAALRLAEALASGRALGDVPLQIEALNLLGSRAHDLGLIDEARAHYEQGLALARAAGDLRWQSGLLGNLGLLHHLQGRPDEAAAHIGQALALAHAAGERQWEGNMRCNLGLLHHEAGRADRARAEFESALELAREMGHARLEATVRCNLGLLHAAAGNLEAARAGLEAAVRRVDEIGDLMMQGEFRVHLARTLADAGDWIGAAASADEAEPLLRRAGNRVMLGVLHGLRAEAHALRGELDAARQALAFVERVAHDGADAAALQVALERARARLAAVEPDAR